MAFYENLPIYKKAMDLAILTEQAVKKFPRSHRYSLGQDLRTHSQELLKLIIKVNSRRDKRGLLTELRDHAEILKTLVVLAKELKAFSSFKEFEGISKLVVEICKQSEGWLKSQYR